MPDRPTPQNRRPKKVTAAEVVASVPENLDSAAVEAELATVDIDALYDEERAAWETEVWDRTSPINGVPAEHFLARDDVKDTGDIYLLKQNGQVVVFQPHEPEKEGLVAIPKGQGGTRGAAHADTIAGQAVRARVMREVADKVRGRAPQA